MQTALNTPNSKLTDNPKMDHVKNFFSKPFVVMDTEFTTWDGAMARDWSLPNEWREIVQIAAVKIDPTQGFKEVETLDVLATPILNPPLSDYFQQLTALSQAEREERGTSYPEALKQFTDFAAGMPVWSYGGDDKVLMENCIIHQMTDVKLDNFFDIRMIVKMLGDKPHDYSSGTLYTAAGIDMTGHVHNALHDCRSIVEYLKHHFN